MLIAARNGFMAGGGWKNPYPVMDSCVAWWDGIWNAGGGQHDANATVWKDLMGDADVTLTNGAVIAWQSTGCEMTSGYFSRTITQSILDAFVSGKFTIEIVCNPTNTAYGHAFSVTGAREEVWIAKNERSYLSYGSTSFTSYLGGGAGVINSLSSIAYSIDGANGVKFYNATADKSTNSLTVSAVPSNTASVRLFGGRLFSGLACEVRFHSRALTAAEIAANYAVDKVRFNLP